MSSEMSSTTTTTTTDEPQTTTTEPTTDPPSEPTTTADAVSNKLDKMKISTTTFLIWPPTQRTRDAVTTRLIETLSTPSLLSNRYGTLSPHDASSVAASIESSAFSFAAASSPPPDDSVDAGIELLQVYSKHISKLVLEAVKSKSSPPPPSAVDASDASVVESAVDDAAAPVVVAATEESSSVDHDSSSPN